MSWDLLVVNLPDVESIDDIPKDYVLPSLGKLENIIARIKKIIPKVDFSHSDWVILIEESFSIEFSMGTNETCDSFMLHVRGGGNAVLTISYLLKEMRLRAYDCQSGDFFTVDSAQGSFADWQAFRDGVISDLGGEVSS